MPDKFSIREISNRFRSYLRPRICGLIIYAQSQIGRAVQYWGPKVRQFGEWSNARLRAAYGKYRKTPRRVRSEWGMFIATCAMAVSAIATAFLTYHTWEALRGQLDEMRFERRPWISVSAVPTGKIDISDGQMSLPIKVTAKNTGDSPAGGILISAHIFPPLTYGDAERQNVPDERCNFFEIQVGFGKTLFPNDNFTEGTDADPWPIELHASKFEDMPLYKGTVLLCARYLASGRDDWHITGKRYNINLKSAKDSTPVLEEIGTYAN